MAKNVLSLQLLRNSALFNNYAAAVAGITGASTNDGTIKLARFTDESGATKTIFGIYHDMATGGTGYTIYDGDHDVIENIYDRLDAIDGGGSSSGTIDQKIAEAIDALDYTGVTTGDGVVVTNVTETSGVVAATAAEVGGLKLTDYSQGSESGHVAANDTINAALAKLQNQIDAANDVVNNLDYDLAKNDNKVVVSLNQTNGKISGESANITSVKLDGYAEGSDAKLASTDTLGEALGKLQGQINGMDKAASVVDGQVVTTVTQADGKVTETKANVKDLQLGGYSKDTTATGDVASTDTINTALSKIENKIVASQSATTVASADKSINVTTAATGTDINVNIKSGEHVLAKGGDAGLYTDIKLSSITPSSTAVKEEYQLTATDGTKLGDTIKIYKDSSLVSITYITDSGDTHYQNLEYKYVDASGNTQTEYVDISSLVLEAEFASGVTVTNHVAHGVVDPTSETFLTVGTDGFKLDGVQDAIDSAINGLDVTGDTAVAGQYITHINEENGKIQIGGRANVSDAVLNGYSKGEKPASTAIAATDDVKGAIAKLEHQIDDAKAAATTKVVEGTDAGNNMTITPATGTDGSVTYTISLADVASASALTKEITDRTNGDTELSNRLGTGVTTANTATAQLDALRGTDADTKDSVSIVGAKKYADDKVANVVSGLDATVGSTTVDSGKHVAVQVVEEDGKLTALTVTENDIASKTDLDAEIAARKAVDGQTGQTYAANSTANYINNAQSLNDADVKLDAALKAVETKVDGDKIIAGSGITATSAATGTTVDVKLKADAGEGDNDWHNPLKFDADDKSLYFDAIDAGEY